MTNYRRSETEISVNKGYAIHIKTLKRSRHLLDIFANTTIIKDVLSFLMAFSGNKESKIYIFFNFDCNIKKTVTLEAKTKILKY